MGMLMRLILQLAKLCIIGFALIVHGSSGLDASPSPAKLSVFPHTEGNPGAIEQRSDAPSMASQPNGSDLLSPSALPPLMPAPVPETTEGHANLSSPSNSLELPPHDTSPPPFTIDGHIPSLAPSSIVVLPPPHDTAPPPFTAKGDVPSLSPSITVGLPPPIGTVAPPLPLQLHTPAKPPTSSQAKEPITPVASPSRNLPQISPAINPFPSITPSQSSPVNSPVVDKGHVLEPTAPAPIQPPLRNSRQIPPATHSSKPDAQPPSANQGNSSNDRSPVMQPVAPAPVAAPSGNPPNQADIHASVPNASPPSAPIPEPTPSAASPPRHIEKSPPPAHSIMSPSILTVPAVQPPGESPRNLQIINPNVTRGTPSQLPDPDISPASTPTSSNSWKNKGIPVASPKNEIHKPVPPVSHAPKGSSSAISPSSPKAMGHHKNSPLPSLAPSNSNHNPPAFSPSILFHKHKHTRRERTSPASAPYYLIPPPMKHPGPAISPEFPPGRRHRHYAPAPIHFEPLASPKGSPSLSPLRSPKVPPPPLVMTFPPPPPNEDCSTTVCTEPYTNTPPGAPCGCVLPMQVGLRLSVALYTFFPLVSELAAEIAGGFFMKQSQVRIMGANAASEQPDKTVVMIDLVPLGEKFDKTTALLTFQRFWHKQVAISTSLFGDYEVLYVRYLGLPPSPPLPPDIGIIDAGPYPGNDNNARAVKPLGVDVHGKQHRSVLNGGMIAIVVLSALVALLLCSSIVWVLLFKHRGCTSQQGASPPPPQTALAKPSGSAGSIVGSGLSSTSLSFSSSIVAYTGSAKTFTASDIEKATGNFDASRILGEGGFGRVYSGVLDDDTKVAVKVLKRDDQQGGREFLAEVEMLSRLHHRNLVKLIGICTEERMRCLVYELIPNGSVESYLHGVEKESAPLDWVARIKIALGAARGLAYLHEDSSPRVIHRDFKSSNILLEHDFTPKVSDFGLARTAMDEAGRHISTRVMGTFGYVAPEYAMTGHLLVKSDVYSYGVVLLELLTGRKPVDMTQPPGQENLVAWARPLLTTKEGLETIIDKSLGSDIPFDSVAKVAAIASMCVQPEVSHRPFMGEVVQALKLVCNECDEAKEAGSRGSSHDNLSIDLDVRDSPGSGRLTDPLQSHYLVPNYDSCHDTERGLSVSELFSSSARLGRESSGSFRRHFSSGPLRMGRGSRFWQRLSRGSISEHGFMVKFWPSSH